nr:SIR2 family protein [Kineococcus aurantiacus]
MGGGRGRLLEGIWQGVSGPRPRASVHQLLAQLPVRELWTTNYDTLIEDARQGLQVVATEDSVLQARVDAPVLYKMHGSISHDDREPWVQEPVITRTDYERYAQQHPLMSATLTASYLTRTMLFLGFSFNDPNIEVLLRLARSLPRHGQHLTVLRRPTTSADIQLHELRVRDLEQSGVKVCEIAEYGDLEALLSELVRRTRPPRVFISGSGADEDIASSCQALAERLAQLPAWQIASLGGPAGWHVTREVARQRSDEESYDPQQLLLFFRAKSEAAAPALDARAGTAIYSPLERLPLVTAVISESRALVAIGGGDRTAEEITIAHEHGVGVIPLPRSGGSARQEWQVGLDQLSGVRGHTRTLGGAPIDVRVWKRLDSDHAGTRAQAVITLLEQAMYTPGA